MVQKANYRHIAGTYDASRPLLEQNIEGWMDLIAQRIGPRRRRVAFLDLGCGTGRFAIPIAERLSYAVTGADNSPDMLAKAQAKDTRSPVSWERQHADALTYPDESFDAVFMSHLLHHVDDPPKVIAECHRVLRSHGVILNRYGANEHIRNDPEHRFFPETVAIDAQRTPTVGQVETWYQYAGFTDIQSTTIRQHSYATPSKRLEAVTLKSTSVLSLIPDQSFEAGVKAFRAYIAAHPDDPWLLHDQITLTSGKKNS